MGRHVDNLRAEDMSYIRVTDDWAYGERASWRSAEKFDSALSELSPIASEIGRNLPSFDPPN